MASSVTALMSNSIKSHAVQVVHFPFLYFPFLTNKQIDLAKQAVLNKIQT